MTVQAFAEFTQAIEQERILGREQRPAAERVLIHLAHCAGYGKRAVGEISAYSVRGAERGERRRAVLVSMVS
jgi:hypothetical protein